MVQNYQKIGDYKFRTAMGMVLRWLIVWHSIETRSIFSDFGLFPTLDQFGMPRSTKKQLNTEKNKEKNLFFKQIVPNELNIFLFIHN